MLHPDWNTWLERGRALISAPPLSRADKSRRGLEDPKWGLGDLLTQVPDHLIERLAIELTGDEERAGAFRQYRSVSQAWPLEHRVAASWTAHRELKDTPDRFTLIEPGMTMRQAASAAGKKAFDSRHPRLAGPEERALVATDLHTYGTPEERITQTVNALMDREVNKGVRAVLEERKASRAKQKLAKLADDERSAEYKEALANLRRAQSAKSPETAYLEVVFKLQQSAEYVRAILAAVTDSEATTPLIAEHRKPDIVYALDTLVDVSLEALDVLRKPVRQAEVIDIDVVERSRMPELLESTFESDSDQ